MLYAFYSFKGGVGRSMTLANIGELFHEKGLRTLLIDWDLEAPGLEAYFSQDQAMVARRDHPGLIDLLSAYKERVRRSSTLAVEDETPPRTWIVNTQKRPANS